MCRRGSDDPLVKMFLERYKLNLLSLPRERVDPGDVFIARGRNVSAPGPLRAILQDDLALPPAEEAQPLGDLAGVASERVGLDVGLGLLQGFLAAIGAGGVINEIKLAYSRSRAAAVRFAFEDATLDFIDPPSLALALEGARLRTGNPLVRTADRFYVAASVARTPSVSLDAEDDRGQSVQVGTQVVQIAEASAKVTAEKHSEARVTYRGERPLAIGVELYELRFDEAGLSMYPPDTSRAIHAGRPAPPPVAAQLDEEDAFIVLSDEIPAPTAAAS